MESLKSKVKRHTSWAKNLVFSGLFLTAASWLSCGCNNSTDDAIKPAIEYAKGENWVAWPEIDKSVDVFYVYPTVTDAASGAMDITNADERALAVGIYKSQASVFFSQANVFAPYYRQMSTSAVIPEGGLATDTPEFKQGAVDVQDAFSYYMEHLNNGRPYILAGHSQGTMALIELIKNKFAENNEISRRLIAAYLIGYTVTDEDLASTGLVFAQNATDIGVVITYNTQSVTSAGGPMLLEGAHCINPLNWQTDGISVDSTENLGAVFYDDATGEFIREVPHYCGAQINLETHALTTTIPDADTLDIGSFPAGVYHRYDYAFWYRNLQKNIKDRIESYFANK